MIVIVNDHGFSLQNDLTIAADLSSDFDPEEITSELLQRSCIRITLDSFADGRGFTLAARLRQCGYQGHLRLAGYVLADQYAMARRSGFDDVEISQEFATRQPEPQWLARADWRAHDYQSRLRRPAGPSQQNVESRN
ncbi:DUF934 domain-containing protein [uncultured Planktomarina sp.]|jgi:uncharacterized protein (DUF934 family)|uniref:DUF934 domain-containing protein n=1 Tax=uncultured Planktomarina sp. TaxID=1538529 RepID=UPI003261BD0F